MPLGLRSESGLNGWLIEDQGLDVDPSLRCYDGERGRKLELGGG